MFAVAAVALIFLLATNECHAGVQETAATETDSWPALPTTFLVVRHADREGEEDRLSERGMERARDLAELGELLQVDAIYSTAFQRSRGSAEPLAERRSIPITIYEDPSDAWLAEIADRHAGEVVLIVGHSNTAGSIAARLAGQSTVPEIAHDEYDSLFVVTRSAAGGSMVRIRFGRAVPNPGAKN